MVEEDNSVPRSAEAGLGTSIRLGWWRRSVPCKPRVTATDAVAETGTKRARMPHKLMMRRLWRLLGAAGPGATTGQGDFTVVRKLRSLKSWRELQDCCTETRITLAYESP